ncbi:T9SS type A sorting domain-containing protein [Pontibacter chitinilyticus]|uniref:T9SS type A sorting domain-containing protein n=1 Tax=Pontibacter chitinilyticus TaxID=2674989 RepID=UPI00321B0596
MSATGLLTNAGTIFAGAGTYTFSSIINNGAINAQTSTIKAGGTLTNAGTFSAGSGTHTFTGNVTNSGTITAASSTIQLGSAFTNTNTFTPGTGTVVYNGTAAQAIAPVSYNNLTLAGAGAKTASTNLSIGGNLQVNAGATFAASGTANLTHTIAGSVTNNGTLNATAATAANQLTVAGGFTNGSTGTFNGLAGTYSVKGNLTNSGTFNGLSGTYTVTGNFTNSNSFNGSNGSYTISGNWVNTGTFSAGTSVVTLNGTNKTITATGTGNFNDLTVSVGATALASNIVVDGTLRVDNAVLTTSDAYTLFLGKTATYATATAETSTANVTGNLQTTRTLVQGSPELFGNIGLRILASTVSIQDVVLKRVTGKPFVSSINGNNSVPRLYYISTTDPNVPADGLTTAIEMSFPAYQLDAGTTAANYDIYRSTDNVTVEKPTKAITTSTDYAFKVDNPQKFGMYTISNVMAPLPVELAWFKAARQAQGVYLTWMTASEKNNSGFEVQVSGDGKTFRSIGFVVSAAITTATAQHYSYLDKAATVAGTRYYRLAQIDLDGKTTYSTVKSVTVEAVTTKAMAYPNPFTSQVAVQVAGGQQRLVQVTVANAMGKVLHEQQVTLQENEPILSVDMTAASEPGVYLLYVTDQSTKYTFKMTRQ